MTRLVVLGFRSRGLLLVVGVAAQLVKVVVTAWVPICWDGDCERPLIATNLEFMV